MYLLYHMDLHNCLQIVASNYSQILAWIKHPVWKYIVELLFFKSRKYDVTKSGQRNSCIVIYKN